MLRMPVFAAIGAAVCGAAVCASVLLCAAPSFAQNGASPKGKWTASGTLLEACTCAPPCSCNFGEGPSPHSYCYAVFGYRLQKASYDGVDLSGLVIAAADGPKGESAFIDSRASAAQRPALQKLARLVFAQGGAANTAGQFVPAPLVHEIQGNHLRLQIGQSGGWEADVIVGRDGKTPVVVQNNLVWPIANAVKGRTTTLSYKDAGAGAISGQRTNANYGAFSFGGAVGSMAAGTKRAAKTVHVATVGTAKLAKPAKPSKAACCAGK